MKAKEFLNKLKRAELERGRVYWILNMEKKEGEYFMVLGTTMLLLNPATPFFESEPAILNLKPLQDVLQMDYRIETLGDLVEFMSTHFRFG